MIDAMQAILQPNIPVTNLFAAASRYSGIETVTLEGPEGRITIYLRRRFIPNPGRFETLQEHTISQGERLDNLAAQYLGDPLLFWRLCDANRALEPDALTEAIGRRLRIALPEGIIGSAL